MWIFLPFIIILVITLFLRKYQNPYNLTIIFGKIGSGKSTLCIKLMLKDLRQGWNVYTDMPDCKINGVHFFNTKDLAKFAPPPNSSIYFDEAGLSMDNRKYNQFPDGLRDFFALMRKYKCKVTMNSQAVDVDIKIRNRAHRLVLVTNIANVLSIVRPINRNITLTEATSQADSRIADQLKFAPITSWRVIWLPRYFRYFSSFNPPHRDDLPNQLVSDGVEAKRLLKKIKKKWN